MIQRGGPLLLGQVVPLPQLDHVPRNGELLGELVVLVPKIIIRIALSISVRLVLSGFNPNPAELRASDFHLTRRLGQVRPVPEGQARKPHEAAWDSGSRSVSAQAQR